MVYRARQTGKRQADFQIERHGSLGIYLYPW
jgi:hypothetical protein